MKTCLNCGELIGDNADECFKCHYNYKYKRVVTPQEIRKQRERMEQRVREKAEQQKKAEEIRQETIAKNGQYEYKVETIRDNSVGKADVDGIQRILTQYASNGWKLHTIFTNQTGQKTYTTITDRTITDTVDQTIMVFERRIG